MLLVYGLRNVPQKFQLSVLNKEQAEQLVLLLFVQKWGNFESLYLSNESKF